MEPVSFLETPRPLRCHKGLLAFEYRLRHIISQAQRHELHLCVLDATKAPLNVRQTVTNAGLGLILCALPPPEFSEDSRGVSEQSNRRLPYKSLETATTDGFAGAVA